LQVILIKQKNRGGLKTVLDGSHFSIAFIEFLFIKIDCIINDLYYPMLFFLILVLSLMLTNYLRKFLLSVVLLFSVQHQQPLMNVSLTMFTPFSKKLILDGAELNILETGHIRV
jgi:hypothetical protein